MTLKTPHCVHVEKPEASFGSIMSEMRSWFDHRKIEPAEFKSLPTEPGVIALDIRFEHEEEAQLFDQAFA